MTYSKGCCRFVIAVSVMSPGEVSIAQTAHSKTLTRSMGKAEGAGVDARQEFSLGDKNGSGELS